MRCFTILDSWTIQNILSAVTITLAVVGGLFAFVQWHKTTNLQRAMFINQIIEKLRFDKDMAQALYLIDYGNNWYNEKFHGGGNDEFLIDKLLSYLSYVCYLIETGNITKKEVRILDYELRRVCGAWSVQAYLWNLQGFSRSVKSECTFQYLINYAVKRGFIDKSTLAANYDKFPKYLNF